MNHAPAAAMDPRHVECCQPAEVLEICAEALAKVALPAAVRRIVELFDGQRCVSEVYARLPLPRGKAEAVVWKLTQIGVLCRVAGHGEEDAAQAFAAGEEAFFSAELGPIDACDLPFETLLDRVRQRLRLVRLALRR